MAKKNFEGNGFWLWNALNTSVRCTCCGIEREAQEAEFDFVDFLLKEGWTATEQKHHPLCPKCTKRINKRKKP